MSRSWLAVITGTAATTFLAACSFTSLEGFSRVDEVVDGGASGGDATTNADSATQTDATSSSGGSSSGGDGGANDGAANSYAAEVLSDNPVGYYRFTDTTGDALVDIGSKKANGTFAAQTVRGVPGPIPGDFAIRNDGTAWAAIAGDDFDFAARDAFSLEAWIKIKTTISDARGFIGKKQYGTDGYSFWVANDEVGFGRYFQTTYEDVRTPIDKNVWVHVAGTYDGTILLIYVNGVAKNQGTSTVSLPDRSSAFAIGGKGQDSGYWFDGDIDEVAVYDKVLPASRIAAHYAAVPK